MDNKYRLYKKSWIIKQDPHLENELSKENAKILLSQGGVIVRNTFLFDKVEESSFWYVIKDSFGGMEELSSNMRNQVRKCFKTIRVERISSETLLANGYEVFCEAAEDYKIKTASVPSKIEFENRICNAEENDYWGCFEMETGRLVAFSMNFVGKESCEYRTMKALPEFRKKHYAYYGLIYEMNRYYLEEKGLKYVNDGARSITNHSNMQPFLIDKFKFRKAYCNIKVYYQPIFGMAVRVLYPFRRLIKERRITSILNMEAMARNEFKES